MASTAVAFFPSEVTFPALYGGVDRLSTKAFLSWLDLVYPLPMQAPYSSLLVLPPRWGGDAPGTDLIASQIDLVPYHQHLCLISPVPLMPLAFRNVSRVVLPGGASILPVPTHVPGYSADCSRNVSHEVINNSQNVSSDCHHTSMCDSKEVVQGWPVRKK